MTAVVFKYRPKRRFYLAVIRDRTQTQEVRVPLAIKLGESAEILSKKTAVPKFIFKRSPPFKKSFTALLFETSVLHPSCHFLRGQKRRQKKTGRVRAGSPHFPEIKRLIGAFMI